MSSWISNVSLDKIIELLVALLGIGSFVIYISVKVTKKKDSNKIGQINQKIVNGNNNNQSGRDTNGKS